MGDCFRGFPDPTREQSDGHVARGVDRFRVERCFLGLEEVEILAEELRKVDSDVHRLFWITTSTGDPSQPFADHEYRTAETAMTKSFEELRSVEQLQTASNNLGDFKSCGQLRAGCLGCLLDKDRTH